MNLNNYTILFLYQTVKIIVADINYRAFSFCNLLQVMLIALYKPSYFYFFLSLICITSKHQLIVFYQLDISNIYCFILLQTYQFESVIRFSLFIYAYQRSQITCFSDILFLIPDTWNNHNSAENRDSFSREANLTKLRQILSFRANLETLRSIPKGLELGQW